MTQRVSKGAEQGRGGGNHTRSSFPPAKHAQSTQQQGRAGT